MHRGLVAVSASAIAAVYMAGYLRTQSADASIGAAAVQSASVVASAPIATNPAPSATPTAILQLPPVAQGQVPTAPRIAPTLQPTTAPLQRAAPPPTAPPAPAAPQQAQSGALKDGTFAGQGSSRRGDVWVSVDVQAGRIANVTITRSTLQYPLRDIAGLPSQVVQRQTAQVDIVSRATYSSQAFRQAVSQALSKAA
jgi:uncharacterized protein with FMN-binding domain